MEHVRALAVDIGIRATGTQSEERGANYIRDQLAAYGYETEIRPFAIDATTYSQNVVAEPPGAKCRMVVGGHYDSVPAGPGANDNASGTATVIEIARVLAADGVFEDVCFALFGAEEIGLVGSAVYVSELTPEEAGMIEGMLNFDMLAVGDSWPLVGSREIIDVAAAEAERIGVSYRTIAALPENLGSDHASFIQAGIPAMIFNCFCDQNYHSAADRIEFVQEKRLEEAGAMGLGTIAKLLQS